MPTNINSAFRDFMTERVNLDANDTKGARASRDWLLGQLASLPLRHSDFPVLYPEINLPYGSFARRTKIRELDDVDLLIGISGLGTTYADHGGQIRLSVPDGIALRQLCYDGSDLLNSRRVVNKFVKHLSDIPQYKRSDIKRDGVAAVLDLASYPWSFDIVPAFMTTPEYNGRTYYIIPDGEGHWMRTDPRIDQARVREINQARSGNVLNVVRLLKFWNRRTTMPSMSPYLLECMILEYYESSSSDVVDFPDYEARWAFEYIATAVYSDVQDPKGIQGNINELSWDDRRRISDRAATDAKKASDALEAERSGDHKTSMRLWQEILGPTFPAYG